LLRKRRVGLYGRWLRASERKIRRRFVHRRARLANTVTALATAQSDGSPVLLMSGEVSTLVEGLGLFQDASPQTLDDVEIVKPVVRYSSSIDNPRNLPHLFKHAMLLLRTQPTGPVHLSLPQDSLTGELSVHYTRLEPDLADPATLSLKLAESSLRHLLALPAGSRPQRS